MQKVKTFKSKQKNKKMFLIGRILIFTIIFVGLWMFSSNLYKFSRGFFADHKITLLSQAEELLLPGDKEMQMELPDKAKQKAYEKIAVDDRLPLDKKMELAKKQALEPVLYPIRPELGEVIGELYIPKIDATLPIYHGTNEEELDLGVGHYADSVLPGENDNCILAGHRDTVFRKLGEVGEGDLLIVHTSAGEFEYTVNKVRIVDANDRTVIVPKPKATLTVSTCYPFTFIGSAPQRYILVAYLSSKTLQ
jgi:sortase A